MRDIHKFIDDLKRTRDELRLQFTSDRRRFRPSGRNSKSVGMCSMRRPSLIELPVS